jgi:hypothetical protein
MLLEVKIFHLFESIFYSFVQTSFNIIILMLQDKKIKNPEGFIYSGLFSSMKVAASSVFTNTLAAPS